MKRSVLRNKSYRFAVRIVNMSVFLRNDKKEYILSKQIVRSGTAIGASIREAEFAQSDLDFIHKFSVSLKEANETQYWLDLLKDTGFIEESIYLSMKSDCKELISMLVASINTLKSKLKTKKDKTKN